MPILTALLFAFSSWSVASISIFRLMVSSGAPCRRKASDELPPSPDVCAWSVRARVSGLYWNSITLDTGLNMSMPIIAPFIRRGELGNVVMVVLFPPFVIFLFVRVSFKVLCQVGGIAYYITFRL